MTRFYTCFRTICIEVSMSLFRREYTKLVFPFEFTEESQAYISFIYQVVREQMVYTD